MCDAARTSPSPRWGTLYGLLLVAFVSVVLVRLAGPAAWRGVLSWSVGVAAVSAVARWIGRNRVALDQSQWCACASASVRMRTIPSVRRHALARPAREPEVAVGVDEPELEPAAR